MARVSSSGSCFFFRRRFFDFPGQSQIIGLEAPQIPVEPLIQISDELPAGIPGGRGSQIAGGLQASGKIGSRCPATTLLTGSILNSITFEKVRNLRLDPYRNSAALLIERHSQQDVPYVYPP